MSIWLISHSLQACSIYSFNISKFANKSFIPFLIIQFILSLLSFFFIFLFIDFSFKHQYHSHLCISKILVYWLAISYCVINLSPVIINWLSLVRLLLSISQLSWQLVSLLCPTIVSTSPSPFPPCFHIFHIPLGKGDVGRERKQAKLWCMSKGALAKDRFHEKRMGEI